MTLSPSTSAAAAATAEQPPYFLAGVGRTAAIVALFVALAATAEAGPNARKAKIKVVSYNLYLGASIFRVFDPPACGAAQAVYDIHSIIQQTDFPARAKAIADQIAMQEPHVVAHPKHLSLSND